MRCTQAELTHTSGTVAVSDVGAELPICRNRMISFKSSRSARNISRKCGKVILPPVFARLSLASMVLNLRTGSTPHWRQGVPPESPCTDYQVFAI